MEIKYRPSLPHNLAPGHNQTDGPADDLLLFVDLALYRWMHRIKATRRDQQVQEFDSDFTSELETECCIYSIDPARLNLHPVLWLVKTTSPLRFPSANRRPRAHAHALTSCLVYSRKLNPYSFQFRCGSKYTTTSKNKKEKAKKNSKHFALPQQRSNSLHPRVLLFGLKIPTDDIKRIRKLNKTVCS